MIESASKPILQANDLTFRFQEQQIFNHFSVSVPAGLSYVVGGESTGKSTLLRLLAGDLNAQAGQITINGISQTSAIGNFRKNVFWTDPRTTTHDHISVRNYFELQRQFYPTFNEPVLTEFILGLSLTEHLSKDIYMLSAGTKRKVWLAAAFASGAAVTLLDEPFAALDKASIAYLLDRLKQYAQNTERAWVIADHNVAPNLFTTLTINLDV